jgi:adenosylcobinamide kinase/adenosylcobinamide-phosphate guanylyltransferase
MRHRLRGNTGHRHDPEGLQHRNTTMIELVLGGARSGKSRYAEQSALAAAAAGSVFIATAQPLDDDMAARIARHQADRDERWQTVEAPIRLAAALERLCAPGRSVVVDCLTLWMTNLLLAPDDTTLSGEQQALLALLPRLPGNVFLVSNETGMGIVPLDALSRRFVDETGRLHQQLAALCDRVTLLVAGLPLRIKPQP